MMERDVDTVSMLVDDQLAEHDMRGVIQTLKTDAEAGARWENYHLIGDAMRGHLPAYLPTGLAERVSRSLEHEPVYFKPQSHTSSPAPYKSSSRNKATLGFALAASLSAITVFSVSVMEFNNRSVSAGMVAASTGNPGAKVAQAAPDAQLVQLAALAPAEAKKPVETILAAAESDMSSKVVRGNAIVIAHADKSARSEPPVAADLYDYLVNYHQYAQGPVGNPEMLSSVQLVGYGLPR